LQVVEKPALVVGKMSRKIQALPSIDNQIGKNAREKETTMQKPQKKSTHRE